jgi:hypothetical protein
MIETGDPTLPCKRSLGARRVSLSENHNCSSDGEGGYDTRFSGLAVGKYVFLRAGVSSPQNADTLDGLLIRLLACQCLE